MAAPFQFHGRCVLASSTPNPGSSSAAESRQIGIDAVVISTFLPVTLEHHVHATAVAGGRQQ